MKVAHIVGLYVSKLKDHAIGVGQKGFAAEQVGWEMDVMGKQEEMDAMNVPEKVFMIVLKYFVYFYYR